MPFLLISGGGDHCKLMLYGLLEEACTLSGAADGAENVEKFNYCRFLSTKIIN